MLIRSSTNRKVPRAGIVFNDVSLAVQSAKQETDINTIVERFGLTGTVPQNVRTPLNVDFNDVFDYQTAMNAIIEAKSAFIQMPADVRKRFNNDPGEFVDFASDPKNQEEARKLGLALPVVVDIIDPPVKVEIINPAPVEK